MAAAPRSTSTGATGTGSALGNAWLRVRRLFALRRVHPLADDAPPLVRVLAGNCVTSATILSALDIDDARHLRRLHPAVAGAVAGVPWCNTDVAVVDVVRLRAGLPGAVGARLDARALEWQLRRQWAKWTSVPVPPLSRWAAAVGGLTHLDLHSCKFVTDDLLLHLPASLRALNVCDCRKLTTAASFAHLTELTSLDCRGTPVVNARADGLPPSLRELRLTRGCESSNAVSLAHLRQLRVLYIHGSWLGLVSMSYLPPSLEELHCSDCEELKASFAHLTALRVLNVAGSAISNASLATVPPCLVSLNARGCNSLTAVAVLPRLPALQLLDVSGTAIGDALVVSLPASLIELRLAGCRSVTAGATLGDLPALRELHCVDTALAPAVIAGCRARGCTTPAASVVHRHRLCVGSLALLADGRLACGENSGTVQLRDVATGSESILHLSVGDQRAMAALRDGRRLAISSNYSWMNNTNHIEVWDVGGGGPPARCETIPVPVRCDRGQGVCALAALLDGRLAAGCDDGRLWVVDAAVGVVVAELSGHTSSVTALAVLPDGTLASGSRDNTVRLWDVATGACVAILAGHTGWVSLLAALPDGRLVSGAGGAVRLWDVRARACVGELTGRLAGCVTALAALPDGRLATGSADGTIQLWDTRPVAAVAAAGSSRAVSAVPVEIVGVLGGAVRALVPLPDGRLACGGGSGRKLDGEGVVCLLELPPPAAYRYE